MVVSESEAGCSQVLRKLEPVPEWCWVQVVVVGVPPKAAVLARQAAGWEGTRKGDTQR